MRAWISGVTFVVLTFSFCVAQDAGAAAPGSQSSATGAMRGTIQVALAKSLDSKKLKVGDTVEAQVPSEVRTTAGMTIPRGSKVTGHVTEVKARSKGDAESTLGIVFDKITLGRGEDKTINGVIQAVAPNPSAEVNTGGGVGYGGMNETMEKPPTPNMNRGAVPLLTDQSTGVLGMKNLELSPAGVLTSSGKDVKLETGTRILLKVSM